MDIIERTLSAAQFASMSLGPVDPATVRPADIAAAPTTHEADATAAAVASLGDGDKPSLESCINLYDFEAIAKQSVQPQGWAYYSSGADDEVTLRENHSAFHRIWMRPRVMVNVKEVDMSTTILGHKVSMPMFLSAVAMCKLGHPDGEVAWQRASGLEDIIYMIPTLSGCSFDDIVAARAPMQPMYAFDVPLAPVLSPAMPCSARQAVGRQLAGGPRMLHSLNSLCCRVMCPLTVPCCCC